MSFGSARSAALRTPFATTGAFGLTKLATVLVLRARSFESDAPGLSAPGRRLGPTRRGQGTIDAFLEWQQWTLASFLA